MTNTPVSATRRALLILPILVLLGGCGGSTRMEPVETLTSGDYQVSVLAPGGTFKSGENPVSLQLLRDGQPVAFRQALLVFSTADAPTPLQVEARLAPNADSTGLEGKVAFGVAGAWNGQVAVVTEAGPLTGAFQVLVR